MGLRRQYAGFTLIELLVTLAIAAILAVVAVPSYQSFIAGQRTKTAAQNLFLSMQLARSEAIKRNTAVDVANSGSWVNGWTVAVGGTTIRAQGALDGVTIDSGGINTVTYNIAGRLDTAPPTFTICDTSNLSTKRQLTIDLSGIPQLSQGGSCP